MEDVKQSGSAQPISINRCNTEQRGPSPQPATQFSRADILDYINETCTGLIFMAAAHDCERLTQLLAAAACEAELQAERDMPPQADAASPHDDGVLQYLAAHNDTI